MTLRPNYLRAITITYLWIGVFTIIGYFIACARSTPVADGDLLSFFAVGGTFMAACVCVMFVPRELSYDADGFSCRMIVQGSHTFSWSTLEAFGNGNNVFLLKFAGHQAIQISGFGFRSHEWKEFKNFLKRTYPAKKCWFWFGPKPMMRKR